MFDHDVGFDERAIEGADVGADGFLKRHVRHRSRDVQPREERQRAGAVVHGRGDVVGLRVFGEAAGFADAADPRGIDHDVVGGAALEDEAVILAAGEHLADGDGQARFVAEVGEGVGVVHAHDVFEPHGAEIAHRFGDAQRGGELEEAVAIEQNFDFVADAVADFFHRFHAGFHGGPREKISAVFVEGAVEGPEFHRAITLGDEFLGEIAGGVIRGPVVFERAGFADVAVAGPALVAARAHAASVGGAAGAVVNAHAVADLAAEELPDGASADLAENVPEREVEGADGAQFRAAAAEGAGAFVEEAPVVFNRERVRAEKAAGHPIVNHRGDGVRDVVSLTVTNESGIGVNAHEQQAGHDVVGDDGFDGGDFEAAAVGDGLGLRRNGGAGGGRGRGGGGGFSGGFFHG